MVPLPTLNGDIIICLNPWIESEMVTVCARGLRVGTAFGINTF